jgi:hypothetical protein
MAIAHRRDQTKPFILKCDEQEPRERQTVFMLRSVSARAKAKMGDSMLKLESNVGSVQIGSGQYAAVQLGIAGWSNFKDVNGADVKPEFMSIDGVPALTDVSMDRIVQYIPELAQAVWEFNNLSEQDQGNSGSPSAPPQGESSQAETGDTTGLKLAEHA